MGLQIGEQDKLLRGLAHELKNPLVQIARRAELGDAGALKDIQFAAEQSLQLIDSYLLHARSEYGQTMLDLEPVNIGSVLYDTSVLLRKRADHTGVSLRIDDRTHEPVMTNRPAIQAVLNVFGAVLMQHDAPSRQELVLRGYRTREGNLGLGLFGGRSITNADIQNALALQGKAHTPLAGLSETLHVSLAIADGLCRALGGTMSVKRMGRLSGLATELPPSEQLALV